MHILQDGVIEMRSVFDRVKELRNAPASEMALHEFEELSILKQLLSDLGIADNLAEFGESPFYLVADSYMERHAEELAKECDLIDSKPSWPFNCIDWKKAADMLRADYASVEICGKTYWYDN